MRIYIIFFALALISFNALAQGPDTATVKSEKEISARMRDSVTSKPFVPKARVDKVYHPDSTHNPHKAVMRSLMIPGWGQIYNRRWWKLPVIYGGLISFGLAVESNNSDYHVYLKEARRRDRNDPNVPVPVQFKDVPGGSQQFYDVASNFQRNFQLSILGFAALWGINIIDAYIDAKFIHSYSVDNNLSFKVTPSLISQPMYAQNINGYIPSVKVTFVF